MVVESIGEEELSLFLFVECGEGGQPCSCEVGDPLEGVPPNNIGVEGLVFKNNHEVDDCLGGSLCRSGEEDADGLMLACGGGEGEYKGIRMEYPPADARAAPSASAPNDTVMDIA
eukprot:scaffold32629_cov118-Isochrysis_galbana.AAC.1